MEMLATESAEAVIIKVEEPEVVVAIMMGIGVLWP